MTETTTLYRAHKAAEALVDAIEVHHGAAFDPIQFAADMDLIAASDVAYAAWRTAIVAERAAWDAIPDGEGKDSAITNAMDTEGTAEDELKWLEVAVMTYRMNGIA